MQIIRGEHFPIFDFYCFLMTTTPKTLKSKQKAYFMPLITWEPIFVVDFPLLRIRIYRERSELVINLLAGAPDTTYRLSTTNPGFQLQRT